MIPSFTVDGLLPPGIHWATWSEVDARFGHSPKRRMLLEGLGRAIEALRHAGCSTAYINGSFTTARENPADFDGCWDVAGVDLAKLDPTLYDFDAGRRAQKRKYSGELFPASAAANAAGMIFLDYFQVDAETTQQKGIIAIDLRGLP